MTSEPTESDRSATENVASGIKRRVLLKSAGAAGAGLAGVGGLAGVASAGGTPDQLYFCGCSQVVVTGLQASATVTVYLRAS